MEQRTFREGRLTETMASIEDLILLPKPRSVVARTGAYRLTGGSKIVCQGEIGSLFPIAHRLQLALWENQRIGWTLRAGDPGIYGSRGGTTMTLAPGGEIPAQGYRLRIADDDIDLVAGDAAGAFYGVMTLVQMLRQCEGDLPAGEIEDSPDLPSRGVMLDISRSKVPTLETLFSLVDMFCRWKINHLELYTEHTFAYENHRYVWAQAKVCSVYSSRWFIFHPQNMSTRLNSVSRVGTLLLLMSSITPREGRSGESSISPAGRSPSHWRNICTRVMTP